jgi:cysteinyl-tRNA synthetase
MVEVLYDDLNTAQTMAVLHGLRNAAVSGGARERGEFAASLRLLGFLSMSVAAWNGRKQQASGIDPQQVERLIAERAMARARKDFKESDRIRDDLAAMGIAIKDGKDSDGKSVTTWEIAR